MKEKEINPTFNDIRESYGLPRIENKDKEIERLKIIEEKYKDSQLYIKDFKDEIEKLQKQKEELLINGLRQETLFKLEIKRLNNIINDIDRYIHNFKLEDIGEKTMLILNDILLIKNGMGNEVVRLNGSDKE